YASRRPTPSPLFPYPPPSRSRGLVTRLVGGFDGTPCRGRQRLMAGGKVFDHLRCLRSAAGLLDDRQARELREAARGKGIQGTDALRDFVVGGCQFRVLGLEQGMKRREHRTGHVPVIVLRLEVEDIAAGQQRGQLGNDLLLSLR